ncbi:unnamed protein product, partial [Bubo scandiacus]
ITAFSISSTLINQTQQWLQERHYLMQEALRMSFEHISSVNMISNEWLVCAAALTQEKKEKSRLPHCCLGVIFQITVQKHDGVKCSFLWSDDTPYAIVLSKILFITQGRKQQLSMNELFVCESK